MRDKVTRNVTSDKDSRNVTSDKDSIPSCMPPKGTHEVVTCNRVMVVRRNGMMNTQFPHASPLRERMRWRWLRVEDGEA